MVTTSLRRLLERSQSSTIVYQSEPADCGLACLSMLSQHFGNFYSLNEIRSIYGSTRGGVSLYQLVDIAERISIRLIPYEISDFALVPNEHYPFVLVTKDNHYFLVIDHTTDGFTVHDPSLGYTLYSFSELQDLAQGVVLHARPIHTALEVRHKGSVWKTIKSFFVDHLIDQKIKLYLLFSLLLIVVSSLFELANAQIQNIFFDWILQLGMVQWAQSLAILQLIVGFFVAAASALLIVFTALSYTNFSLFFNQFIFRKLLRLPESFFLNRRRGDVIATFDNAEQLLISTQSAIVSLAVAFVNLLILLPILLFTSFWIFLFVVFLIGLSFYIVVIFLPSENSQEHHFQKAQADCESLLLTIISNLEQIRLEGREAFFLARYNTAALRLSVSQNKLSILFFKQEFLLNLVDALSFSLLILLSAILIIHGKLSLGQYVALQVLISLSLTPIVSLGPTIRNLQEAYVSIKRLADLTSSPLDPRYNPSNKTFLETSKPSLLELKQLWFQYSISLPFLLSNLSAKISLGSSSSYILDGPPGCGKTTLARILAARQSPSSGQVLVDGVSLSSLDSSSINRLVVLVDGLPLLISANLLENLLISTSKSASDAIALIGQLGLSDLALFRDLYRVLDASASGLSGGELVIVQIVRSILLNPAFVIYDDIFASLPEHLHLNLYRGIAAQPMTALFMAQSVPASLRDCTDLVHLNGFFPQQSSS